MRHVPMALLYMACIITFFWGLAWLWLTYSFLEWLLE
jgi:hypothetical protein